MGFTFIVSFAIAIFRIFVPSMSELGADIFKDLAHIWVGGMFASWFCCRSLESVGDVTTYLHTTDAADEFKMQAIGLTAREVGCFFFTKG